MSERGRELLEAMKRRLLTSEEWLELVREVRSEPDVNHGSDSAAGDGRTP